MMFVTSSQLLLSTALILEAFFYWILFLFPTKQVA